MDERPQKERLEQELRFLKESFDAEVISKEEFEKGKDRIERKLKDIKGSEKNEKIEDQKPEAKIEEKEAIEKKDDENIKLKVIPDEGPEGTSEESFDKGTDYQRQKREGKFWKFAILFVILVLMGYLVYFYLKGKALNEGQINATEIIAPCSSDADCIEDGKNGACIDAGAKDARCEFTETQKTKTNLIVVNEKKNCFNCDTQRVLYIMESWFGPLNIVQVDYGSLEGKKLVDIADANLLPLYIFNESISSNVNFEKYKTALVKKNGLFVLGSDTSASTLYFKREPIQNRLDIFVKGGDAASTMAEKNLKEFADAFKDARVQRHDQNDSLTKELGIKNFPAFLVNNRIKFSGVQSAETIKENFCKMNNLRECSMPLSRSLI